MLLLAILFLLRRHKQPWYAACGRCCMCWQVSKPSDTAEDPGVGAPAPTPVCYDKGVQAEPDDTRNLAAISLASPRVDLEFNPESTSPTFSELVQSPVLPVPTYDAIHARTDHAALTPTERSPSRLPAASMAALPTTISNLQEGSPLANERVLHEHFDGYHLPAMVRKVQHDDAHSPYDTRLVDGVKCGTICEPLSNPLMTSITSTTSGSPRSSAAVVLQEDMPRYLSPQAVYVSKGYQARPGLNLMNERHRLEDLADFFDPRSQLSPQAWSKSRTPVSSPMSASIRTRTIGRLEHHQQLMRDLSKELFALENLESRFSTHSSPETKRASAEWTEPPLRTEPMQAFLAEAPLQMEAVQHAVANSVKEEAPAAVMAGGVRTIKKDGSKAIDGVWQEQLRGGVTVAHDGDDWVRTELTVGSPVHDSYPLTYQHL